MPGDGTSAWEGTIQALQVTQDLLSSFISFALSFASDWETPAKTWPTYVSVIFSLEPEYWERLQCTGPSWCNLHVPLNSYFWTTECMDRWNHKVIFPIFLVFRAQTWYLNSVVGIVWWFLFQKILMKQFFHQSTYLPWIYKIYSTTLHFSIWGCMLPEPQEQGKGKNKEGTVI